MLRTPETHRCSSPATRDLPASRTRRRRQRGPEPRTTTPYRRHPPSRAPAHVPYPVESAPPFRCFLPAEHATLCVIMVLSRSGSLFAFRGPRSRGAADLGSRVEGPRPSPPLAHRRRVLARSAPLGVPLSRARSGGSVSMKSVRNESVATRFPHSLHSGGGTLLGCADHM